MWNLLTKAALSYLEAHPDQVVALFEQGAEAAINALKAHNAKAKAA